MIYKYLYTPAVKSRKIEEWILQVRIAMCKHNFCAEFVSAYPHEITDLQLIHSNQCHTLDLRSSRSCEACRTKICARLSREKMRISKSRIWALRAKKTRNTVRVDLIKVDSVGKSKLGLSYTLLDSWGKLS